MNSRLVTRIRQKDGLSYSVGSSLSANALDSSSEFSILASYSPGNATRVEAALREEIERVLRDGFTAEEVRAAKTSLLRTREISRAQDLELARKLSRYSLLNRTLAWDAAFEQKITALTPEQIVAAVRRYIDLSKMTVIKAGDFPQRHFKEVHW